MDGAVNMNPSNAPHILRSSEAKKIEKAVAMEAAADEKHVAQVVKALRSAEKDESKAERVCVSQNLGDEPLPYRCSHGRDLRTGDTEGAAGVR
jgi:hypothetical protein